MLYNRDVQIPNFVQIGENEWGAYLSISKTTMGDIKDWSRGINWAEGPMHGSLVLSVAFTHHD